MHMTHVTKTLLAALIGILLIGAGTAQAKTNIAVGIGDQSATMFDSPHYKALKLKKTRYFIPWNAIHNQTELDRADAFMKAARTAKVKVLVHIGTDNYASKKAKLPSVAAYKKDVKKLITRYKKLGVTEWGVWNEANHASQPTYRSPKRAAEFFVAFRTICSKCTIVGLDILDQKGSAAYIKKFYAAVPSSKRKYLKVVGIHNYSDVNRKRSTGTKTIIGAVKKADKVKTQFWLTETGALISFGGSFPCSESRAKNRMTYMFTLAKKFRSDVKRLYSYNWQGTDCQNRFDAGLVHPDGSPRPAYAAFKAGAKSFAR
ncbi:MAG: hypothetical protein JWP18_12 [Solirubrobacterales bacterium]|jgi:hypothetical protein|nr:hypothetical protein [Solirubrobacterales bacterium]